MAAVARAELYARHAVATANQRAAAQVEQLKRWASLGHDPDAP